MTRVFTKAVTVLAIIVAISAANTATADSGSVNISPDARTSLSLSIYGNGSAMVRDQRTFALKGGSANLMFSGVSSSADGTSFRLDEDSNLRVMEKTLLQPTLKLADLLQQSIGKRVEILNVEGEVVWKGSLQTATAPVMVKTDEGYMVMANLQNLVFTDVPEDLRPAPIFRARVITGKDFVGEHNLSYLTSGLQWYSQYSFTINKDFSKGRLSAWATIHNQTDMNFPQANLQLIAGSLNRQNPPQMQEMKMLRTVVMMDSGAQAAPSGQAPRESFAGYHLYRIEGNVDVSAGQTTQIPLLAAFDVELSRKLIHRRMPHFYGRQGRMQDTVEHPITRLEFDNTRQPLPSGQVSVFQLDKETVEQLIGEDRLVDTPAGEKVRITTGQDFDVSIRHHRTDYTNKGLPRNAFEEEYQVSIVNGSDEAKTVVIAEPFPGDWEIKEESIAHRKVRGEAHWKVEVPANGTRAVTYRVRVQR